MLERLLERAVDGGEDAVGHQDGTDRDEASRQRLRHGDDVGLEIPVLEAEELAGSAEAGLHLIEHEQGPV